MKLYFNGCSHTWGDDLQEPLNHSWPALVSRSLGCEFFNDGQSGGTNDRIIYRTIKHIDEYDKFYLAWTYVSRFTRYRSDNNHDVNFNVQLRHHLYGKDLDFKNYGDLHYRTWYNELYSFKIWLQNIILMQSLFKIKNKKYVMINATDNNIKRWSSGWPAFNNNVKSLLCFDRMSDCQLKSESDEIQKLITQIDFSNFYGWNTWCITSLKYPKGPTGHFLNEGHQAIADFILEHDSL